LLAGLSGVLLLVAHPVASEWDRLLVPIWIPVALTAGLASDALSSMKLPWFRGGWKSDGHSFLLPPHLDR
jgi:hypothetical protein